MSENPIALMKQAHLVVLDVLGKVTPEQMDLPTVNDDWDVRALVNHLVGGNAWTAEQLRTGNAPRPPEDSIGDRDALAVYEESAHALIAAIEAADARGGTIEMPWGDFSAARLAEFRCVDLFAHAWDLAQATGQSTDLSPALAGQALALAQQHLSGWDRAPSPYKDEVPIPTDAPAADRLAAFLGKPVG